MIFCPKCGADLLDGVMFCRECGHKLFDMTKYCTVCGNELKEGDKFCNHCGTKVVIEYAKVPMAADNNSGVFIHTGSDMKEVFGTGTSKNMVDRVEKDICELINEESKGLQNNSSFENATTKKEVLEVIDSAAHSPEENNGQLISNGLVYTDHLEESSSEEELHDDDILSKTHIEREKERFSLFTQFRLILESQEWFSRIVIISVSISVVLLILSFINKNWVSFSISVLQIIGLGFSSLMQKKAIRIDFPGGKLILLLIAIIAIIPNILSYSMIGSYQTKGNESSSNSYDEAAQEGEPGSITIVPGSEYSYRCDKDNVYIATAVTENVIKIECWERSGYRSVDSEYDYEVGVYRINDVANGFTWVDDEHNAFTFKFKDGKSSSLGKGEVIFTIDYREDNVYKGTNLRDDLRVFFYHNDDRNVYFAIPMSDKYMKIENWVLNGSSEDLNYGYDVAFIDISSDQNDFEWTNDLKDSFLITLNDTKNSTGSFSNSKLVSFELTHENYKYNTFAEYTLSRVVGEGQAAAPFSSESCKGKNYQDVIQELLEEGFTNIVEEPLYDIALNWNSAGLVESVLIDEKETYEKGEVFDLEAPIKVVYHQREKDDPNNKKNEGANSLIYKLVLHISSTENWVLSKYDIHVYVDGEGVYNLNNGEKYDLSVNISPGNHSIVFTSALDDSVCGEITISDVASDIEASVVLISYSSSIKTTLEYVDRKVELKEDELKLGKSFNDYKGEDYKEVVSELKGIGFVNIKTEPIYDIVFGITSDGSVSYVSIKGETSARKGDIYNLNDEIIVAYHTLAENNPSNEQEISDSSSSNDSTSDEASSQNNSKTREEEREDFIKWIEEHLADKSISGEAVSDYKVSYLTGTFYVEIYSKGIADNAVAVINHPSSLRSGWDNMVEQINGLSERLKNEANRRGLRSYDVVITLSDTEDKDVYLVICENGKVIRDAVSLFLD